MTVKTLSWKLYLSVFVVSSCRRCEEAVGPSELSREIIAGVQVSAETLTETHTLSHSHRLTRVRPSAGFDPWEASATQTP